MLDHDHPFIVKLEQDGYKHGIDNSYYKYNYDMVYCLCNEKPPVIQVKPQDIPDIESDNTSISVTGQTKDGYWINIDFYTLSFDEIIKNLRDIEEKLITAWNSIN